MIADRSCSITSLPPAAATATGGGGGGAGDKSMLSSASWMQRSFDGRCISACCTRDCDATLPTALPVAGPGAAWRGVAGPGRPVPRLASLMQVARRSVA